MVEPETQPLVNQQTVPPVQETSEELVASPPNKKKSKWLMIVSLVFLLLVVGGISIYAFSPFHRIISSKSAQHEAISISVTPTVVTPVVTQPMITDSLYRDQYIQFSFDPSWIKVDLKQILKVKPENIADDPMKDIIPICFFSASKYPEAKKIIDTYQAQAKPEVSFYDALEKIGYKLIEKAELTYEGRYFVDDSFAPGSEASAENWAKIYGSSTNYFSQFTTMTIPTPQIQKTQEIRVNNRKAYMVLLGSGDKVSAFVIIDGKTNETFQFIFTLEGVNAQELSNEQKKVLNSIKIF